MELRRTFIKIKMKSIFGRKAIFMISKRLALFFSSQTKWKKYKTANDI